MPPGQSSGGGASSRPRNQVGDTVMPSVSDSFTSRSPANAAGNAASDYGRARVRKRRIRRKRTEQDGCGWSPQWRRARPHAPVRAPPGAAEPPAPAKQTANVGESTSRICGAFFTSIEPNTKAFSRSISSRRVTPANRATSPVRKNSALISTTRDPAHSTPVQSHTEALSAAFQPTGESQPAGHSDVPSVFASRSHLPSSYF